MTRAYLNSHSFGISADIPNTPAPVYVPTPVTPTTSASNILRVGSSGPDVLALQQFLRNYPAFYPTAQVTGYYGTLTRDAVGAFQLHYVIVASPNEDGYGTVGPRTKAKIDELSR